MTSRKAYLGKNWYVMSDVNGKWKQKYLGIVHFMGLPNGG